jgi:APA family basic amino acid/polyamine antiporter
MSQSPAPPEPLPSQNGLRRELSEWDAAAIIIGIIIGVGIFRVPGDVARQMPSTMWILGLWLLGGILSLVGAFCYAELSAAFPRTGGDYVYLSMAYGRWAGFLFGWAKLVVIRTGSIAAMAIVFAEYMGRFFSSGAEEGLFVHVPVALAIFGITLLTVINIIGLRFGRDVQNFLTVVKLLALGALILLPVLLSKGSAGNFQVTGAMPQDRGFFSAFGAAMVLVLWTYGGWSESALVAGEVRDPSRALPRSLILGTLTVTLVYVLTNVMFLYVYPATDMAGSKVIGADVGAAVIGPVGGDFVAILVVISTFGALNGLILTGARITYAAGQDHPVFFWLGRSNERYGTPALALVVQGLVACGLVIILRQFEDLVYWTGFAVWLFYGMVGASLYILRRKYPDVERPYRTWGYPVTPLLFVLVCAAMMVSSVWAVQEWALLGAALILVGLPVYLAFGRTRVDRKAGEG